MTIAINIILGVFISALSHPLHMSYTNIEYDKSSQKWEVSIKLFKDDFADELNRLYKVGANFEDSISSDFQDVFKNYVTENFDIRFDGKPVKVETWKAEDEKLNFEAIWLNYSFSASSSPRKIKVENRLMFGMFKDQKNLLIFTGNDAQKAFQFKHNKPEIEFDLD